MCSSNTLSNCETIQLREEDQNCLPSWTHYTGRKVSLEIVTSLPPCMGCNIFYASSDSNKKSVVFANVFPYDDTIWFDMVWAQNIRLVVWEWSATNSHLQQHLGPRTRLASAWQKCFLINMGKIIYSIVILPFYPYCLLPSAGAGVYLPVDRCCGASWQNYTKWSLLGLRKIIRCMVSCRWFQCKYWLNFYSLIYNLQACC